MMTWDELLACYQNLPKPVPVTYRLYYDDQGRPIVYSMEQLPGNYIEICREDYVTGSHAVRVVKGRLVHLGLKTSEKLIPSDSGTPCYPTDVSIVDSRSTAYWSKHFYDDKD